ncbi:MAG: SURF1 family cytochrome oxidase biogenesis protein [Actinomycetes bacterium]
MMASKRNRFISTGLLVLFLAGAFVELGVWQLHRAEEVARLNRPQPELPIVALNTIAAPGENLPALAINRLVRFSGRYVKSYQADYQKGIPLVANTPAKTQVVTFVVGLFQVDVPTNPPASHDAILVVRGVGTGSEPLPKGQVTIVGRLNPRQTDDRTNGDASHLSRIDPALVAGIANLNLFDGYVVATSEKSASDLPISFTRIAAPPAKGQIAGFYWQHISYVFIWWFLALLVLAAPILSARESKVQP